MNTLTDLLLGVGQPRVSHFPDLCTLLYTYLSTLNYWTKIVYYLFTQTSPVAHTSALTPTYIKSQKLPNWPISKELGLGRMLLPHWKLLFIFAWDVTAGGILRTGVLICLVSSGVFLCTVYPKKYAHRFVVLCFVVVMQSFIMNSHEVFIHIHQGCFAGTGAIVRLPQCQWSKPDGYGKISQCITTTKHSKAKTVCIFLGIYCISHIVQGCFTGYI